MIEGETFLWMKDRGVPRLTLSQPWNASVSHFFRI
jgi:hypothetical protein